MPGAASWEGGSGHGALQTGPGAGQEGGGSRELEGPAPSSHPEASGYSKGHLGLESQGRHTIHGGCGSRRPGQGPSQAGHIYITKGQNWRHWCSGLFIRTSLNRFCLSCLLPFQICSGPLPAQKAQPPPAHKAQPDHMASSCSFRKLGLSIPACQTLWQLLPDAGGLPLPPTAPRSQERGFLRFWLLVHYSGRPGLPWNGARAGEEACKSLEPIPACPSPTPRAREAQQVPQECDQTRGCGWLGGLNSSLPAVSLAPSTTPLSQRWPGGRGTQLVRVVGPVSHQWPRVGQNQLCRSSCLNHPYLIPVWSPETTRGQS